MAYYTAAPAYGGQHGGAGGMPMGGYSQAPPMGYAAGPARAAPRSSSRKPVMYGVGLLVVIGVVIGVVVATAQPPDTPAWGKFKTHMTELIDTSKQPCDDFFAFACGRMDTQLPPFASSVNQYDSVMTENRETLLRVSQNSNNPVLRNWWDACVDEAAATSLGMTPLEPDLAEIRNANDMATLWQLAGKITRLGGRAAFATLPHQPDFVNPTVYRFVVANVFTDGSPDAQEWRTAVSAGLQMAGINDPAAVDGVAAMTTRLLNISFSVDRSLFLPGADVRLLDTKRSLTQLTAAYPNIDWSAFFTGLQLPANQLDSIVLMLPSVAAAVNSYFDPNELPAPTVASFRAYLAWRYIVMAKDFLPPQQRQLLFAYYGTYLYGLTQLPPRETACIDMTSNYLGDPLGVEFTSERFNDAGTRMADDMIANVRDSFKTNLAKLSWLDSNTQAACATKVDDMLNLVGQPVAEAREDYTTATLTPTTRWANYISVRSVDWTSAMNTLGGPVDRREWLMHPATYNAYYYPLLNTMVFPSGMLQPYIFSSAYPPAVNYGGIGSVMGHELTHGFDNGGRLYDASGRFTKWWSDNSIAQFDNRQQCFVQQYQGVPAFGVDRQSGNVVRAGVNDGTLTLSENIADNGGVKMAYAAYKEYIRKDNSDGRTVDRYSAEQVFWLSYAQMYCSSRSVTFQQQLLRSDTHASQSARVNQVLRNQPEFANDFQCSSGDAMVPTQRCTLW
eukprot:PLAT4175.1.p1 GENE.PLAT4175.1~~PLAT4175.1.p1  ORF type:complete len:743 (+),score=295.10 PLAT4175.1:40-2229(+)